MRTVPGLSLGSRLIYQNKSRLVQLRTNCAELLSIFGNDDNTTTTACLVWWKVAGGELLRHVSQCARSPGGAGLEERIRHHYVMMVCLNCEWRCG
jgi:hypothetical protein